MATKSAAKSKRILIIEDESDVAETMKMLLEREGYVAEYTLDPRKGLEMMKKFDLVCLDIIMPIMSGREVLAEIKKKGIKTPVIVVSAVGLPTEVESELIGKYPNIVKGFVSKPYMHTDLVKEIKKRLKE
jgi:CheY-like chemotaxis protein